MALTNDERQRIIEERQAGVPVRQIAARHGHSTTTVVNVYRDFCAEYGNRLAEHVVATHAEQVLEAQRVAEWARTEAAKYRREVVEDDDGKPVVKREGNPAAFARLAGLELSALRHLAKLTGTEAAVQVDVSGQVDVMVNVEERRERVKARLVALCQTNG